MTIWSQKIKKSKNKNQFEPSLTVVPNLLGQKRDVWLILFAKSVRTFSYGSLGVLFPVYLNNLGMGSKEIGAAVTVMLLSSAALTFAIRRPAESFGPRSVLVQLSLLIVLSGASFLSSAHPILVVAAAMLGSLAVGIGETGPFLSLEQVLLGRAVSRDRLIGVMSYYNLAGYVSAALGGALVGTTWVSTRSVFVIFLIGGLIQVCTYRLLNSEDKLLPRVFHKDDHPSRPLVRRLAALFALDAFAGGFVIQSLIIYWFYTRFHLDLGQLGWISFGAQLLSGISFLMAPRIAENFGLVKTMVFTHLISNLVLIALALSPTATVAVILLFSRHLLSQMDVPTRQTFLMLVVQDHEREKAAALTNMSRTLAQSASPAMTGWIVLTFSAGTPILLGGGLKIVYDLLLYASIKTLHPEKEETRQSI
ncbi:MAG: MFS transporter [Nitrospirae bacterium]|nr:MFS transporter [Nitrospirota bacterium]